MLKRKRLLRKDKTKFDEYMEREWIGIALVLDEEAQNEKGEPQILPEMDESSGPGVTELLQAMGIEDSRNSEEDGRRLRV